MTAFTPIDGSEPKWAKVHRLLAAAEVDQTVTYTELSDAVGSDIRSNRNPVYRATRELEDTASRTVEAVPNIGYRIVRADEHERLAKSKHRSSRRMLHKARRKITSADRAELSEVDQQRIDNYGDRLAALEQQVANAQQRLEKVETRADTHDDDNAELRRRIAALEDKAS